MKRARTAGILAFAALLLAPAIAGAQNHTTIVAASAPGGPADVAARILAEKMGPLLRQTIVVENVPGGGGSIGAARVARAAPDGRTLLVHQTGIAIMPALGEKLPFDVMKDFTVIGLINEAHALLIGRKDLPADTFPELIDLMKKSPTPLRAAHPGVGSLGHLQTALWGRYAGAELNLVPYRGMGPALNDVLGGHIDVLWGPAAIFAPLYNAGKVKAYLFSGPKRSPFAPNVASISEFQASEVFSTPIWHALFAPANMPEDQVMRLNAAMRMVLADPKIVETFRAGAVEVFPEDMQTPAAGADYVKRELARWDKVVKDLNFKQN